jgi:two-component system phosphate regulon response regulator PhoB
MSDEDLTPDVRSPAPTGLVPQRVDAVLHQNLLARRPGGQRNRPLRLDASRCEVHVVDQTITLPYQQFAILQLLASRPYWPYRRDEVVEAVHREDFPLLDEALDDHVLALRTRLGPFGDYVQTVPGFGFRFKE